VPDYLPNPAESTFEVNLTPQANQMLDTLLATGEYLEKREHALLNCFLRYYDVAWPRDHVNTKLSFRPRLTNE
jgi:hypothetical protein